MMEGLYEVRPGTLADTELPTRIELASGELVKVLDLSLPGFGFYVAQVTDHPRRKIIDAFTSWLRSVA